MSPELAKAVKSYSQLFGSYTKAGELKKVRVWLTLNEGRIEFLTSSQSFKAKRVSRNTRVECFIGEHKISGAATIISDRDSINRTYRAYWKSHPLMMLILSFMIRSRIESGE